VRWGVSEDESFRRVVERGETQPRQTWPHSVHAEARGLRPGRDSFYRFKAGNEISLKEEVGCRLEEWAELRPKVDAATP